jgi:mono/diheme cytochrome c family protein
MKKQFLIISTIVLGSFVLLSMTVNAFDTQDPWEAPAKYQKMKNPYLDDADAEKIGRILYSKHCKSCHGTKGLGDGTKAEDIDTPIGDFTDASFKEQTDGSLYYKTFFGRDDMPGFNKKITEEEEKWLLVNYVRSLAK